LLSRKPPDAVLPPDVLLDELEHDIEALRLAFDKYFLRIDRAAPVRQRERLDRKLRLLEGMHMHTTALRFRLAGLRARYVTYGHYWARVLDEIERGIWRRDLARPTPRAGANGVEPAATGRERAREDEPRVADATPSAPAPANAPPPAPVAVIDPGHAREVFDRLIAAKTAAGEPTEGLTFPAFLRKLTREAPKLQEQNGGRPLVLDVEVKAGKVRVRVRAS
jgi:hypothetical protein